MSEPDLEREPFTQVIAERLCAEGGVAPTRARELAEALVADLLDFENVPFGDPAFAWTKREADDLADEVIFGLHAGATRPIPAQL